MERQLPTDTYDIAVNFYERRISASKLALVELPEGKLWERMEATEEIEDAQLRLQQLQRRREVGLL